MPTENRKAKPVLNYEASSENADLFNHLRMRKLALLCFDLTIDRKNRVIKTNKQPAYKD